MHAHTSQLFQTLPSFFEFLFRKRFYFYLKWDKSQEIGWIIKTSRNSVPLTANITKYLLATDGKSQFITPFTVRTCYSLWRLLSIFCAVSIFEKAFQKMYLLAKLILINLLFSAKQDKSKRVERVKINGQFTLNNLYRI